MATLSLTDASRLCLLNPLQRDFIDRSIANNERAQRRLSADFEGVTNERMWDEGDEGAPDPADVRASLARDRAMRDKYSPYSFPRKPYDLHKYFQAVKELDEVLKDGMLSDDQMNNATAHNVDAFIDWTNRCVNGQHRHPKYRGLNLVQARATFMRLLDPDNDDPNLTSPERLRPHEAVHVDLNAYYRGYDEITWKADDEIAAANEALDEDRFLRFCQLKAAEWSPAMMRRELGFDQAMYEAAVGRLKTIRAQMEAAQEDAGDVDAGDVDAGDRPDVVPAPASDEETVTVHMPGDGSQARGLSDGDWVTAVGAGVPSPVPTFASDADRRRWFRNNLKRYGKSVEDLSTVLNQPRGQCQNYLSNAFVPKAWKQPAFLEAAVASAAAWFTQLEEEACSAAH